MIWRIEIKDKPGIFDAAGDSVLKDILDCGIHSVKEVQVIQVYLIEGDIREADAQKIARELIVDAIPRTETQPNVAIGAGGTAFTFEDPFHGTPSIQITPVGTTATITGVESPSSTGGIAHLYNTAGSGVAGTANISATGP